jgi:hypothetical protein
VYQAVKFAEFDEKSQKLKGRIYVMGGSCKEPKGSEGYFNKKNIRLDITHGSYLLEETDDGVGTALTYISVVRTILVTD